jgi:hypothetical protein
MESSCSLVFPGERVRFSCHPSFNVPTRQSATLQQTTPLRDLYQASGPSELQGWNPRLESNTFFFSFSIHAHGCAQYTRHI